MDRTTLIATLGCALFGLLVSTTPAGAATNLAPAEPIPGPSGVEAVVAEDLDGDGAVDLAATTDTGLALFFGDGAGGFAVEETDLRPGGDPASIASADLDGDGDFDLVATDTRFEEVSLLLNDGDGSFSVSTRAAVEGLAGELAVGDLAGDDQPDIAIARFWRDVVTVLPGDEAGGVGQPIDYPTGDGPHDLVVTDLNHDGLDDLATADHYSDTVSVRLATGPGGGLAGQPLGPGLGPVNAFVAGDYPAAIEAIDLDADGNRDLVVANSAWHEVGRYIGAGDGSFSWAGSDQVGSYPESVARGDFNRDGLDDLVAGGEGQLDLLLADGEGDFDPHYAFDAAHTSLSPRSLAVADFNGDDEADVAYVSGGLSVQLGDRIRTSTEPIEFDPVRVGDSKQSFEADLRNSGTHDVRVGPVTLEGPDADSFQVTDNGCNGTLRPSESCSLTVKFAPRREGAAEGLLVINSDAPLGPHERALLGTGEPAQQLRIEPTSLAFAERPFSESPPQVVTATNPGSLPVSIFSVRTDAVRFDSWPFRGSADGCSGKVLAPGGSCSVSVAFRPSGYGAYSGTLTFRSDAYNGPHRVALTGTGVMPIGTLQPSARQVEFGRVVLTVDEAPVVPVWVHNTGRASVTLEPSIIGRSAGAFALSRPGCQSLILRPRATCTFTVGFTTATVGAHDATLRLVPGGAGADVALRGAVVAAPTRAAVAASLKRALQAAARRWRHAGLRAMVRRGVVPARVVGLPWPGRVQLELRTPAGRLLARGRAATTGTPPRFVQGRMTSWSRARLQASPSLRVRGSLRYRSRVTGLRARANLTFRLR